MRPGRYVACRKQCRPSNAVTATLDQNLTPKARSKHSVAMSARRCTRRCCSLSNGSQLADPVDFAAASSELLARKTPSSIWPWAGGTRKPLTKSPISRPLTWQNWFVDSHGKDNYCNIETRITHSTGETERLNTNATSLLEQLKADLPLKHVGRAQLNGKDGRV